MMIGYCRRQFNAVKLMGRYIHWWLELPHTVTMTPPEVIRRFSHCFAQRDGTRDSVFKR